MWCIGRRNGSIRRKFSALVAVGATAWAAGAALAPVEASAQNQPPVVNDFKVVSLHRARPDWDVTTSFCIVAEDPDSAVSKWDIGNGAASGSLKCNLPCTVAPADPDVTANARSMRCEYKPALGFVGLDFFNVKAIDATGLTSQAARVEIDVRNEGLRWELLTAAATGLTSDTGSVGDIPKVLGKNLQDFLFVLNWQTASPRQDAFSLGSNRPLIGQGKVSRNVNFVFQTGLQSGSAAVTAKSLATTGEAPAASTPPSGTITTPASGQAEAATTSAAVQRHFTAGGQVNYSAVIDADGQGTFVELGFAGKGAVDVFVEGASAQQVSGGQFVQLLRDGDTFFRGEAGLRVGLKQLKERSSVIRACPKDRGECTALPERTIMPGERLIHPANLDDLVYFELLYQRNNALANLETGKGDSRNRMGVRIAAQPQIANLPGRPKFLIGVEVSRALHGSTPIAKAVYGLNLSGNKLF
jgi:hypothetical protein